MDTRISREEQLRRLNKFHFICEKTGCWLWSGTKSRFGYGSLFIKGKSFSAHRISYSLFVGEIRDGYYVCHTCDTPACINPKHLFLGTPSDNIRDCVRKGRHIFPDNSGENCATSKLRSDQVLEIRKMVSQGLLKKGQIAKLFSVHPSTITQIIQRGSWKNI